MIFEKSIIIIIIVQKTTTKRSFGLLRARDTNNIEYLNDDRILTPMTTMQTYPSCDVCVHLFLRNFRVLISESSSSSVVRMMILEEKKKRKKTSSFNTKFSPFFCKTNEKQQRKLVNMRGRGPSLSATCTSTPPPPRARSTILQQQQHNNNRNNNTIIVVVIVIDLKRRLFFLVDDE